MKIPFIAPDENRSPVVKWIWVWDFQMIPDKIKVKFTYDKVNGLADRLRKWRWNWQDTHRVRVLFHFYAITQGNIQYSILFINC